jgi:hypothetical protein
VTRTIAALLLAGCVQLDPSKPIELVPDPAWSADDAATLANAAACWNTQFGTQLNVVATPSGVQTVFFHYDVLACWGSWARYMPGEPTHVGVCPVADIAVQNHDMEYGYADAVVLFTVLEHELGHAVGVLPTYADVDSVTGANHRPSYAYFDLSAGGTGPIFAFSDLDTPRRASSRSPRARASRSRSPRRASSRARVRSSGLPSAATPIGGSNTRDVSEAFRDQSLAVAPNVDPTARTIVKPERAASEIVEIRQIFVDEVGCVDEVEPLESLANRRSP